MKPKARCSSRNSRSALVSVSESEYMQPCGGTTPSGVTILRSYGREDVQIDNQPQNLKKYQMYFKRGVIILTLGVYNLNVQKIFECLQTF